MPELKSLRWRPSSRLRFRDGNRGTAVQPTRLDRCHRDQLPVPDPALARRIGERKIPFPQGKDANVSFGPLAQRPEALRKAERPRRVSRHPRDDLFQAQPQVEKFRERRGQVEDRAVNVELMQVTRDGAGQHALPDREAYSLLHAQKF